MAKFKIFRQLESIDCGATCLRMISHFYGWKYDIQFLREISKTNKNGVSLESLSLAANKIGFETLSVELTFEQLYNDVPLPAILFWKESHYVVAYKAKNNKIYIADPSFGFLFLTKEEMKSNWNCQKEEGIALLLNPKENFEYKYNIPNKKGYKIIGNFFNPLKKYLFIIIILLVLISILNIVYPYATKQIMDEGVTNNNSKFILYFLLCQIIALTVSMIMDFIQGWLFLFVRMKFGFKLIASFLDKLIKMPIPFFDNKIASDILLRIEDNKKIEEFLSQNTIHFIISIISFVIFSVVLGYYSLVIFFTFLIGTIISVFWVVYFHKNRKFLNYQYFELSAVNKNLLYEIIKGIADIKINNSGNKKIKEWNILQKKIFRINKKNLKLNNIQDIGIKYITQIKNTIIIGISAFMVIEGSLTFGSMLAISFIIGQLNAPLEYFVLFIYSLQDVKISMERMVDIYEKYDEIEVSREKEDIKEVKNIYFDKVSFSYQGIDSKNIFDKLDLDIKINSVTAIVGISGSGKTTLIKILMNFYNPTSGRLMINNKNIDNYNFESWREKISVVFQDGYIFSDTIRNNIIMNKEYNHVWFKEIIKKTCLYDIIENLPQRELTKIGENGIKLSKGQEQRVLIARAMYANTEILILDEATSALDAKNEKIIYDNLQSFYRGRTVVIIAHRLSTVKNADNIVVLKQGEVVEQGTHNELVDKRGEYYSLVKNQLELGN